MHAEIANTTGFGFAATFALDEEARPLCVALVKATFDVMKGRELVLAAVQAPPSIAGELHGDDPSTSSYRLEPETAFIKLGTDCVLVGHAHASRPDATELDVGFRVGALEKMVRVFGDRVWVRTMGQVSASPPQRFEKLPLIYERAFGGKDTSSLATERPLVELRNPVGRGFHAPGAKFEEGVVLPNIEDPRALISSWDQAPPPACFGFVSPGWMPRSSLAGAFDDAWVKTRMPRLPKDFDRRFFNSASTGLVASNGLHGDEIVQVVGASPQGAWSFRLPAVAPPRCRFGLRGKREVDATTTLDTLVVDADAETVALTWRAHVTLTNGPHDVAAIAVR